MKVKTAEAPAAPAADSGKKKNGFFGRHKQLTVLTVLILICTALNYIAFKSSGFCDVYQKYVYPLWVNTYGRLTSLIPFSFGELLIAIGVFGLPLALILMIILLFLKKGKRGKIAKGFGYFFAWVLVFVYTTETLNCFVLYHTSGFEEKNDISTSQHTDDELEGLLFRIIRQANDLSVQVERDENGIFVPSADKCEEARKAMENIGDDFECLGGFYVEPKGIHCSFFMSQMDLTGIYFPFSMEANYNTDIYAAKQPATICHELAHTKGFMREEEANFIAFAACDNSGCTDLRYSGYLMALSYVRNKVFEYADEGKKIAIDSSISQEVWIDIEENNKYWKQVEEAEDTVFDSKKVSEVSDKAMETSLQLNGVEDGKKSYGRMVDLMLNYYGTRNFVGE